MCSRGEPPRIARFFFLCAGDVMAACTCGWGPAGGSNSLPDGSVHRGRGTRQLHDVTGKVQQVRLCLPCKDARGASAALEMRILNL